MKSRFCPVYPVHALTDYPWLSRNVDYLVLSAFSSILVSIVRTWPALFVFSSIFRSWSVSIGHSRNLNFDGCCTLDIVGSWSVSLGPFQYWPFWAWFVGIVRCRYFSMFLIVTNHACILAMAAVFYSPPNMRAVQY